MKSRHLLLLLLSVLTLLVPAAAQNEGDSKKSYIHRLQLADKLRISVYQEDDLTTQTRIDAHGRINLPLIGEVVVGNLTVNEAQDAIQRGYRDGRFLRNPQVTVTVEEYAAREVSIQGQIRNPGRYTLPIESTFTVVELVTKAGGITDIGKGTAVTITRLNRDGSQKTFVVDVESLIRGKKGQGKNEDNILLLEPGDIVYIPERLI
jgi:polysaccharide biosynthesis/export protein